MDYAYFGPAADWPLASVIASVTGIALLFGQQVGQGARALTGLAIDDLRRFLAWLFQPWLVCVALLIAPLASPRSIWVVTLRGAAGIEAELELARADGYYEALTRSAPDRRDPQPIVPPPGRKAFADAGLMDEVLDYRRRVLRPNLDVKWNGTSFRTNRLGFRSPEISRGKPPGTFRVVVLGSSNSMGHGVEEEQTYVRLLEAWLRKRAGAGLRVEVVNLAVAGDSPTQQLLRLQMEGPSLEPDWVLSDITALDLSLEEQHLRWVVGKGVEVPFDFVRKALSESKLDADDSLEETHKKLGPLLKPMLDQTFAAWASEAHRIGASLTVLILPRADSKTESPGLFRLYRDLADRSDLAWVDLSDCFDSFDLDEYRVAPWDQHPNAFGHRLIFSRLRDGLIVDETFQSWLARSTPQLKSSP